MSIVTREPAFVSLTEKNGSQSQIFFKDKLANYKLFPLNNRKSGCYNVITADGQKPKCVLRMCKRNRRLWPLDGNNTQTILTARYVSSKSYLTKNDSDGELREMTRPQTQVKWFGMKHNSQQVLSTARKWLRMDRWKSILGDYVMKLIQRYNSKI